MKDAPPGLRVYYNSACPVCSAGVSAQRGLMGACDVEWIDVHAHPEAVDALGLDLEAVRERLVVREAEGDLRIGADAFAALWSKTPAQRWLGHLLLQPWLRPWAQHVYDAVARRLYRWNRRKGRW
ncbi:MAG: thiol-disulfide oxidoreductase DCC family protein [Pseudomonadota bacterium]